VIGRLSLPAIATEAQTLRVSTPADSMIGMSTSGCVSVI
jgi:hypothetical protein